MEQPSRIFIVTPAFNMAGTIERTLTSVLTQEGDFDLHYHVQDGGSTDGTLDILKRWKSLADNGRLPLFCRSIRFTFDSRPDRGMYDAICAGFETFQMQPDDWMSWINADDLVLPGTCGLMARIDTTPTERHIKWVVGSASVMRDSSIIASSPRPNSSETVRHGLADGLHGNWIQQEGTFFRKSVWSQIDIASDFRNLKYAGDWNLWRRFAEKVLLYQVDRPLGVFRLREGQLSAKARADYMAEIEARVPAAERLLSLKALASRSVKRRVIRQDYPSGRVYHTLEDMTESLVKRLRMLQGVAHDADWQFPAITEKHAYEAIQGAMTSDRKVCYFAFPWATLIDHINAGSAQAEALLQRLDVLKAQIWPGARVMTVCQHVDMRSHRRIFDRAGVSDIFWSHAIKGGRTWPGNTNIRIWSFPLYPAQAPELLPFEDDEDREVLFSFVGARANSWYLSEARTWILERLADDPRGVVIGRDSWHYDKIVYDHQIRAQEKKAEGLVDRKASEEFKAVLRRSTFSLCPSGSGPNSIRLWESIAYGSIPVILSDIHQLPGDPTLWEEAAVVAPETEDSVAQLPDQLEALARDKALIARKRRALRQLWLLYGPQNFVHDLRKFYIAACEPVLPEPKAARLRVHLYGRHSNRTPMAYPAYRKLFAESFVYVARPEDADLIVTGFDIDFKENLAELARLKAARPALRFVVISEEPLWDTAWSSGLAERRVTIEAQGATLEYEAINHANSDVFEFEHIPYFVTTNDDFFARYNALFTRNAAERDSQVLDRWTRAASHAVFLAEKRHGAAYERREAGLGIEGLSAYRTDVAAAVRGERVVRAGLGWANQPRRQDLADWHLDKLAHHDGRTFLFSALENTHQKSYVTEKVFDAFAVGAVPIYYAAADHGLNRLVSGGFLNLHGQAPEKAAKAVETATPTLELAQAWLQAQARLAAAFVDPARLHAERRRVADRVTAYLTEDQPAEAAPARPAAEPAASRPTVALTITTPDMKPARPPEPVPAPEPAPRGAPFIRVTPARASGSAPAAFNEPASTVAAMGMQEPPEPGFLPPPGAKPVIRIAAPTTAPAETAAPVVVPTAAAPARAGARFTSVRVVEMTDLGVYRHINLEVIGLQTSSGESAKMYLKFQRMRDGVYALAVAREEITPRPTWRSEQGEPVGAVSLFFKLTDQPPSLSWSVNADPDLRRFILSCVDALPDMLDAAPGRPPEEWLLAAKAVRAVAMETA